MPELPVKEVRLPELHLPELKREEIIRTLSEVRVPDVDVRKVDVTRFELPRIDVRRIDLGKLLAGALASTRLASRFGAPVARRRRWPIVGGAIGIVAILAVIGWALMRSPAVREQTERAGRLARERFDSMRAAVDTDDLDTDAISDRIGNEGETLDELEPATILSEVTDVAEEAMTVEEAPTPA